MKATIYNEKGKKSGDVQLPEELFGVSWNADLLHQVVVAYRANARPVVAHAKDRSEVRGGGIKPWRQKGTGRARHGSIRSPIWTGGGVTHGPLTERDFSKKVNKKMKKKALAVALSSKVRDKELVLVEGLSMKAPKTKDAKDILNALSSAVEADDILNAPHAVLILLPEKNSVVEKSFRNFGNVEVMTVENITAYDVLRSRHLVVVNPEDVIEALKERVNI